MFNEVHNSSDTNGFPLAFIKSLNVQAFPCGRRRSQLVETDANNVPLNEKDKYYIPFDPEARLNTEANNRKHSSLNGFTQTYLKNKWEKREGSEEGLLSLVLGGYLFNIKLDADYSTITGFGENLATKLAGEDISAIYANIRIQETPLFRGFASYNTEILHSQSRPSDDPTEACLDLLVSLPDNSSSPSAEDVNNYYFSGLSFSAQPLAGEDAHEIGAVLIKDLYSNNVFYQRVISLKILEKDGVGNWQVYKPALLPKIEHGEADDSIKVGAIETTGTITASKVKQGDNPVPIITVDEVDGIYQLCISAPRDS